MPTAVKFSEEFYGRFGHQAVDELVSYLNRMDSGYRSELETLNERNFERFEDKLGRGLGELRTEIHGLGVDLRAESHVLREELRAEIGERIGQAERRLTRWLFAFWATTQASVVAILVTVLLKL